MVMERAGRMQVAIYRLLQKSALAPEDFRCLEDAYERTLRALCLKDRNDPLTELIAKKIIQIAESGLRDPAQISARAIEEFGVRYSN